MTNTALQVTDFNFYGDSLIALRDNSTGEIYAAINHILRSIGLTEVQIRKRRDKWINDPVISKGVLKFNIPYNENLETDQKRTPLNNYETYCISQRKLPLALAKINITPKMRQNQPEIAEKLELYQDKCADVLASVFIDRKTTTETINNTLLLINKNITNLEQSLHQKKPLPEKKYSRWKTNTFDKLNLLMSYVNEHSHKKFKLSEIIHLVIEETEDTYGIELNDYVSAYESEFILGNAPLFPIDIIHHYKDVRDMYTLTLDSILEKLHILNKEDYKKENIFDVLAAQLK